MKISHYTCEPRSILTRTCIKLKPVAFALHLSADRSATYSSIRERLCDAVFWGSHEALAVGGDLGNGRWGPGTGLRLATAGRTAGATRSSRLHSAGIAGLQLGRHL